MRLHHLLQEAQALREAHEDNFWVVTTGLTAHQIATALGAASPGHHLIDVAKGKQAAAFNALTPAQRQTFRDKLAVFKKGND